MSTSLILRTATRYLLPVLTLFSVFLLLVGHHAPGGGFVGGLVSASAIALCALAFDVETARRILPMTPRTLVGIGLMTAGISGLWGLAQGVPFLTAYWGSLSLPEAQIELGTPLLFDLGVYFVVTGVVLAMVFALAEA